MQSSSHPNPAQEARIVHLLLLSALLQTVLTGCGLWAIGLVLAAGRSEMLQDWIAVCTAVASAILKLGLHLLGF